MKNFKKIIIVVLLILVFGFGLSSCSDLYEKNKNKNIDNTMLTQTMTQHIVSPGEPYEPTDFPRHEYTDYDINGLGIYFLTNGFDEVDDLYTYYTDYLLYWQPKESHKTYVVVRAYRNLQESYYYDFQYFNRVEKGNVEGFEYETIHLYNGTFTYKIEGQTQVNYNDVHKIISIDSVYTSSLREVFLCQNNGNYYPNVNFHEQLNTYSRNVINLLYRIFNLNDDRYNRFYKGQAVGAYANTEDSTDKISFELSDVQTYVNSYRYKDSNDNIKTLPLSNYQTISNYYPCLQNMSLIGTQYNLYNVDLENDVYEKNVEYDNTNVTWGNYTKRKYADGLSLYNMRGNGIKYIYDENSQQHIYVLVQVFEYTFIDSFTISVQLSYEVGEILNEHDVDNEEIIYRKLYNIETYDFSSNIYGFVLTSYDSPYTKIYEFDETVCSADSYYSRIIHNIKSDVNSNDIKCFITDSYPENYTNYNKLLCNSLSLNYFYEDSDYTYLITYNSIYRFSSDSVDLLDYTEKENIIANSTFKYSYIYDSIEEFYIIYDEYVEYGTSNISTFRDIHYRDDISKEFANYVKELMEERDFKLNYEE